MNSKAYLPWSRLVSVASAVAILIQTGCASPVLTKYQRVSKGAPPPAALNLSAVQPPVEAILESVIVDQGPGSWKRVANWDEYVVRFANRGDASVTLESVSLIDSYGDSALPGSDPWKLEMASSNPVLRRTKPVYRSAKVVGLTLGAAVFAYGQHQVFRALGSGHVTVGAPTALVTAAFVGGIVLLNAVHKHDIEREFVRRRLVIPATVAANGTIAGSFFFRRSPRPQRLVLRYRVGDEPRELAIDLKPLAGLHLKE